MAREKRSDAEQQRDGTRVPKATQQRQKRALQSPTTPARAHRRPRPAAQTLRQTRSMPRQPLSKPDAKPMEPGSWLARFHAAGPKNRQPRHSPQLMRLPNELLALILSFVVDEEVRGLPPPYVRSIPFESDDCPIELPTVARLGVEKLRVMTMDAIFNHSNVRFCSSYGIDKFLTWLYSDPVSKYTLSHNITPNFGGLRRITFACYWWHVDKLRNGRFNDEVCTSIRLMIQKSTNLRFVRVLADPQVSDRYEALSVWLQQNHLDAMAKPKWPRRIELEVVHCLRTRDYNEEQPPINRTMVALFEKLITGRLGVSAIVSTSFESPAHWEKMLQYVHPWNKEYIKEQMRAFLAAD